MLHFPYIFMLFKSPYYWQEMIFIFVVTGVPLIALYVVNLVSKKLKNNTLYFIFNFIFIAVMSYVNFTTDFILSDKANAFKLLLILVPFWLMGAYILTIVRKELYCKKPHQKAINAIKVSIALVLLILLAEAFLSFTGIYKNFLLNIYERAGEFLLNLNINIFYIDYYGFVGVLLSLSAATIILLRLCVDRANK